MIIQSIIKFSKQVSLACTLMLCAVSVQAGGYVSMGPSFSEVDLTKGFYSGLEVGHSKTNLSTDLAVLAGHDLNSGGKIDNKNVSIRAFMGMIFHPNFGIELGIFDMNKVRLSHINYDDPVSPDVKVDVNLLAVDLAAKLILPVTDQIRLFTKAGIVYLRADANHKIKIPVNMSEPNSCTSCKLDIDGESQFTFLLGVGASFAFTEALEVFVAWTNYYDSDFFSKNSKLATDVETKSVGVIYRMV